MIDLIGEIALHLYGITIFYFLFEKTKKRFYKSDSLHYYICNGSGNELQTVINLPKD